MNLDIPAFKLCVANLRLHATLLVIVHISELSSRDSYVEVLECTPISAVETQSAVVFFAILVLLDAGEVLANELRDDISDLPHFSHIDCEVMVAHQLIREWPLVDIER